MSAKRFMVCVLCASAVLVAAGCKQSSSASNAADGGASDGGPKKTAADAGALATKPGKPDAATASSKHDGSVVGVADAALSALADSGSEPVEADAGTTPAPLEIIGRWHSNWGGIEAVAAGSWTTYGAYGSVSPIVDYDNAGNWLITQNAANAGYDPGKFNKIVWTEPSAGSFYYCTVDFGLATAAAAQATSKTADASDPANGGCGAYSWTKLGLPIAVEGDWNDSATPPVTTTITSDAWGALTITSYDGVSAIRKTSGTPPMYSKVVFTQPASGSCYFCVVSNNQTSAANANTNAGVADAQNKTTGCLGATWTKLDAK